MSSLSDLHQAVAELTAAITGQALEPALQSKLNAEFGAESALARRIRAACDQGVADGLLCQREAAGIRYGRVFKPEPALGEFSVDVVDMQDIAGPHHVHPQGEIDLVMPLDADARFDGHAAGWVVYGPGSAHRPTVRGGRARVLYLLPRGLIEFSRA
ncbi:DUF4863 family protein [Thiomonas sp.]|jgi:hypothetical protein|uniref:4-hydroxylaminobenzoate lyase n=1 Tax=Thiomonas sp. TaxID=2047785 RepID=UPI00262C1B84|nr:DUF4863 family protein [Thiomonas sp.]